ncbi:uncharacterized protein [Rutidosis leptorrhynchoides]|uniref:uncharacterized protein n=1 Tax=Rutidosis leptorrhynchoides TaxID=125765 RepID=UPI003A98D968
MVIGSTVNGNCSLTATSVAHRKWKPRKVSAVRQFPPGCGPIDYSVNTVPELVEASSQKGPEVVESSHKVHEVVEASHKVHEVVEASENGATDAGADNGGGPLNALVQVDNGKLLSDINEVDKGGDDVKKATIKKFPRRKVSAVRHFPPFCGLNAPEPTEEERVIINGKRKCEKTEDKNGASDVRLIESTVNDSGNESLAKQKVEVEDGKIEKVEQRTKVHNIGQACQALVVYARDNKMKRKCSDDEDSEDDKFRDTMKKDVKNIVDNRVGYEKSIIKRKLIGSKGKGSQDLKMTKQRNEEREREEDDDNEFVVDSEERERKNQEKS